MEIAIVGHLHIRDIRNFLNSEHLYLSGEFTVNIKFKFVPGATFKTFLDSPSVR